SACVSARSRGWRTTIFRGGLVIVPASDNQEADQHQYRDAGDPAPHSASSVISAHHGIAQARIRVGKTWVSHGHHPPWFGTCRMKKPASRGSGSERVPLREPKVQVTRIARRQAAQNTKKKAARNAGKLAVDDQCSTVRPTP